MTNRKKWILEEYGFFASMGGFKVKVDEPYSWILCNGCTLTPWGALLLDELGLLPALDKSTIMDKSKMDNVAKVLFILQGLWFLVEISSCWAGKMTVTLLELTTAAHTICAIALYAFWWRRKPKDVNEAQPI